MVFSFLFTNKIWKKKRAKKDGNLPYTPWSEKHALQNQPLHSKGDQPNFERSPKPSFERVKNVCHFKGVGRGLKILPFRCLRTRTFDRSWSSFMASADRELAPRPGSGDAFAGPMISMLIEMLFTDFRPGKYMCFLQGLRQKVSDQRWRVIFGGWMFFSRRQGLLRRGTSVSIWSIVGFANKRILKSWCSLLTKQNITGPKVWVSQRREATKKTM